jgi:hypothetical protein
VIEPGNEPLRVGDESTAGLSAEVPSEGSVAGESRDEGGSNSVVESQPSKLLVAGSIPVSRSKIFRGAAPLGLPHAVARGGPQGPRSAPAGAPAARQGTVGRLLWQAHR